MKFLARAAFAVIGLLFGSAATSALAAEHLRLNDTGLTHCVTPEFEWTSACAKSFQDAAYGRDVSDTDPKDGDAGFSFRKVCRSGEMAGEGACPADPTLGPGPDNWGCNYDNVSQLTWEVKTAEGTGLHDWQNSFTNKGQWARDRPEDAAWLVDATNAEGLCGATNWRLPDMLELHSIVDYGAGVPGRGGIYLDTTFFRYANWLYWTRIQSVEDHKAARAISFLGGQAYLHNVDNYKGAQAASARLVHGKARTSSREESAGVRYIPSADGAEVMDTKTGLVWRRCAEGMVWNSEAETCDGSPTQFTWTKSLAHAKDNRAGGWRIPNLKELLSIVDYKKFNPSIDLLAFPNTPAEGDFYTTNLRAEDNRPESVTGTLIDFYRGGMGNVLIKFDDYGFFLRLVRRGRE
jgi:hypothetical protein